MAIVRDFQVNNGLEVNLNANVVGTATALDFYANSIGSTVAPSVTFDFKRSKTLDNRLTFSRSSNAAYRNANGFIATAGIDSPRFNYNSNGQCLGVLIEKAVTNDVAYSTAVGNLNFWGVSGGDNSSMAIQFNAIQSPDGANTASLFYHNSNVVTYKTCSFGLTIFSNRIYTHSFFAKNNNEPTLNVVHYDGLDLMNTITFTYYFSTNTFGPIGTGGSANCAVIGTPRAEPYANGWVRISYSYHYTNGTTRYVMIKNDLDYATAVIGRGYYLWGHQHEWNDKPSTFIYTTTGAATRAAEYLYCADGTQGNNLTSWLHPNKGTISVEWDVPVTGPTVNNSIAAAYSAYPGPYVIWKSYADGNSVLSHLFYTDASAGKLIATENFNAGVNQAYYGVGAVANGVTIKTTVGYDYLANNIATTTNGAAVSSGGMASNAAIPTVARLDIGSSRANALDGHIKTFRYWPNKLSNADILNTTLV